jgi:hypothetical protein
MKIGAKRIPSMMISNLLTPKHRNENKKFVLYLPDFDSQNIKVDEKGNVIRVPDCGPVQKS